MPFFSHQGLSLFYTDEGAGQPILLLHGWCGDSHDWSFQIPALLTHAYRVIALDQRGHGRSSTPPEPYSPHIFAADAAALLQHLDIPSVVVMAHSMSTITASILAVTQPGLVTALVLVHPIYGAPLAALAALVAEMRADPGQAPQRAAGFFEQAMYTARTPAWIKTLNRRRVLGSSVDVVIGCLDGIVRLDGSVTGQSEEAKEFMRRRGVPRLVVSGIDPVLDWEREIGLVEGVDEVRAIKEGTFLHQVESELFNGYMINWLAKTL